MACPDCFRGGISLGTPTGSETTIHGLKTYVARPDDGIVPKGLIVMIPDAFGWDFVNNRVLCDSYAKKGGFLVYLPDFMNGWSMSTDAIALLDHVMEPAPTWLSYFSKPISVVRVMALALPWMMTTRISVTLPRVVSFMQALRKSPPPFETKDLKVVVAGFCWGGKHAVSLAHDLEEHRVEREGKGGGLENLVDCVFTAHPSFLDMPKDIEAIRLPTSIAVGDQDNQLSEAQVAVIRRIFDRSSENEINVEKGAKHGYSIRLHPGDEHEAACAVRAEQQAIDWFSKHCLSTSALNTTQS